MYTNPVYIHLIILWLVEGTTGEGNAKYVLSSRLDVDRRREGVNFVFLARNSNEGNKRCEKMRKCRIYIYIHSVERIFSNVIPLKVGRKF